MTYSSRYSLILIILVYNLLIDINLSHARKNKEYNPEEEREIPVRIKLLGDLATPHPDSGIELGFVPKQVYYQVRRYDEKKRLPQSEALKEASTPEEIINAPRLREVLTHKKTQEVYEEQGYEDAGYDHGGSARHKEEKERILEDDETQFGKDNVPRHLDKEREEIEDERDQPSEERREDNRKSESKSDTLNPMNSDVKQRKTKPSRNERKQYDELDEERKNKRRSDREKHLHSSGRHEKKIRNHSRDAKSDRRSEKSKIIQQENRKDPRVKKRRRENYKRKPERRMDRESSAEHENKGQSLDFDAEKYPFYNKLKSDKYTKHSALKYALNPKEIPKKVPNEMSFYESRKHHCDEVTGPDIDVPKGEEKNPDNSELKNPNRGRPRMGKLGESIECLKIKFFGHDPLDNPFFKEGIDV
ncbi:hypothetical protein WDU94_008016 [Cyamophila willieti]